MLRRDLGTNRRSTPHSRLPLHCAVCGEDWPVYARSLCPNCHAGLSCRADTTDMVAPDPPCGGSRRRLEAGADDVET